MPADGDTTSINRAGPAALVRVSADVSMQCCDAVTQPQYAGPPQGAACGVRCHVARAAHASPPRASHMHETGVCPCFVTVVLAR